MRIIRNSIIPFKGYKAINLFGVMFARSGASIKDYDMNHEEIHSEQMKEMVYIPFYIFYIFEFLFKFLFVYHDISKAYRNISFEREAYTYQHDKEYIDYRSPFAWIHLL